MAEPSLSLHERCLISLSTRNSSLSLTTGLSLLTYLSLMKQAFLSSQVFLSHAAPLSLPSHFSLSLMQKPYPLVEAFSLTQTVSLLTDLSVSHTKSLSLITTQPSCFLHLSPSCRSSSSRALSIIVETAATEPSLAHIESFDYILNQVLEGPFYKYIYIYIYIYIL
ncbi:hypothetical protein AMTRI_Chr04g245410 [Amborella trichopoda]